MKEGPGRQAGRDGAKRKSAVRQCAGANGCLFVGKACTEDPAMDTTCRFCFESVAHVQKTCPEGLVMDTTCRFEPKIVVHVAE